MLDHISLLLYQGTLPAAVFSKRRYDLLTRFQSYVSESFVPPAVESSIAWGPYDPIHPTDCSEFEWDVKAMPHVPRGIMHDSNEDLNAMALPAVKLVISTAEHAIRSHYIENDCSVYPVKGPGMQSEQDVIPCSVSPIRRPRKQKDRTDIVPDSLRGCVSSLVLGSASPPSRCAWYNNSCPYNSLLFVLANTWKSDPIRYAECFDGINREWMGELSKSLTLHIKGKYSLEQVRDFMRCKLHREFPNVFIYGKETSPGAITEKWFISQTPFMIISSKCTNGHVERC